MPKIVVIGGGVAGIGAALELADRGHKVKAWNLILGIHNSSL